MRELDIADEWLHTGRLSGKRIGQLLAVQIIEISIDGQIDVDVGMLNGPW